MTHVASPLLVALGFLMAARCSAISKARSAGLFANLVNFSTSASPDVEDKTSVLPDHILRMDTSSENVMHEKSDGVSYADVEYGRGLIQCPKGIRLDVSGTCKEFSLLLDIFLPDATPGTELRPAILIVHGGANSGGDKSQYANVAKFYSSRGYIAFVPNYRMDFQHGPYPGDDFDYQMSQWSSLYPAVRDVKASFRYIVANAHTYGVNVSRIAAMGVSAGAMDIMAAFVFNNESPFTADLTTDEDPTLSTVHMGVSGIPQALIMKSGNMWGVEAYQMYSGMPTPWHANSIGVDLPPLLMFHGRRDEIVPHWAADTAAHDWDVAGGQRCYILIEGAGHLNLMAAASSQPDTMELMTLSFLESLWASPNGQATCPRP